MVRLFGTQKNNISRTKYQYYRHIINKKEKWVKLPHIRNMERYLLARKLMSLNHIFHPVKLDSKIYSKTYKEWQAKVQLSKELPPHQKYAIRTLRVPRRKTKTKVSPEEPSPIPPPTDDIIDNPANPICDLEDLAANTSKHLFEAELAKAAKEDSEEWQCRNWRTQIAKDYRSFDLNEIMSTARVTALNAKDIATPPTLVHIFMENIRYSVYTHQWRLAVKGVEGLLEEMTTGNKCWLLWNAAFLAISNLYKDDMSKIVEYALYTKEFMFCYPRRLGNEVAIWLTQKGYFSQGFQLLEEWHETNLYLRCWDYFRDRENSKRKLIDLIAVLMKAVFQYSCWKRDCILFKEGKYSGTEFSLNRCGETALELFESLIPICNHIDYDTTIFINPLIELMIEFRNTLEAKEVFKKIVLRNIGNGILEALYVEFLEKYFPNADNDIQLYKKRQERFTLAQNVTGGSKSDRKLRFEIAQKYKRRNTVPLVRKNKPTFSW